MRRLTFLLLTTIFTLITFGQTINSKWLQKGLWEADKYYQSEKNIYKADTLTLRRVLSFAPCAVINYPRFKFHDKNQYDLYCDSECDLIAGKYIEDSKKLTIGKGKWEFNKKNKEVSLHYYNATFGSKMDSIETYRYNSTYKYKLIKSSDSLIVIVQIKS